MRDRIQSVSWRSGDRRWHELGNPGRHARPSRDSANPHPEKEAVGGLVLVSHLSADYRRRLVAWQYIGADICQPVRLRRRTLISSPKMARCEGARWILY